MDAQIREALVGTKETLSSSERRRSGQRGAWEPGATLTLFGSDEMGGPRFRGGFSKPPKPRVTLEDGTRESVDREAVVC